MSDSQPCPKCKSEHAYPDGAMWVCPECFHEWSAEAAETAPASADALADEKVRDANGNELQSGDSVTVMKELKIKGASSSIKAGTKVRNIRVLDPAQIVDGHNIACKIDGIGALNLKSEFVKKV